MPNKTRRAKIFSREAVHGILGMKIVHNSSHRIAGFYQAPTTYTFDSVIDANVAVVTMTAHQGNRTWIYARGHAHILHDGEVGMAQAVSYAARRMFESLDRKQENKIYLK